MPGIFLDKTYFFFPLLKILIPQNPNKLGLRKTLLEKAHNFDTATSGQNQSEDEKASASQKTLWDKTTIACCRGNPAQATGASPRPRTRWAREPQTCVLPVIGVLVPKSLRFNKLLRVLELQPLSFGF